MLEALFEMAYAEAPQRLEHMRSTLQLRVGEILGRPYLKAFRNTGIVLSLIAIQPVSLTALNGLWYIFFVKEVQE